MKVYPDVSLTPMKANWNFSKIQFKGLKVPVHTPNVNMTRGKGASGILKIISNFIMEWVFAMIVTDYSEWTEYFIAEIHIWINIIQRNVRFIIIEVKRTKELLWKRVPVFIQDSRMVYCNFNRNLHGIHSKTEAQVGLFVLNTIKLNCITLTS